MFSNEPKKDLVRITRDEHDSKYNARRCRIVNTEFDLKINHKDDSITVHSDKLTVSALGVTPEDIEVIPALECSSIKNIKLYIEIVSGLNDGILTVQGSPVDQGDVWFDICSINSGNQSDIKKICASRLRVIQSAKNGKYELNVYLVGQG